MNSSHIKHLRYLHPTGLCQNCAKTHPLDCLGFASERKADSPSCCKHEEWALTNGAFGRHASPLGAGGRAFKSPRPDHIYQGFTSAFASKSAAVFLAVSHRSPPSGSPQWKGWSGADEGRGRGESQLVNLATSEPGCAGAVAALGTDPIFKTREKRSLPTSPKGAPQLPSLDEPADGDCSIALIQTPEVARCRQRSFQRNV